MAATIAALMPARAEAYFAEWTRTSTVNAGDTNGLYSADFNGDGRADVVLQQSVVRVMITGSNGSLGTPFTLTGSGTGYSTLAIADVTGDLRSDIIAANGYEVHVFPSNGDGTFGTRITTSLSNVRPFQIGVADFNGDGKIDLAVRLTDNSAFVILAGDGAGHFSELSRTSLTGTPYRMATGDIDGDGHADVLIARGTPFDYQIYYGKGDGTFDDPKTVPGTQSENSVKIILADLDGDNHLEILSTEIHPDTVTVTRNLGSRTFAAADRYVVTAPGQPGGSAGPWDLAVLEATGDNKLDVVIALFYGRALATLPGNGDGTLGVPQYAGTADSFTDFGSHVPTYLTASDFDGDGRTEVVLNTIGPVSIYDNAPGALTLTVKPKYPTISSGQTETLTATAGLPADFVEYGSGRIGDYLPRPAGTVTFQTGPTPFGTAPLQDWSATMTTSTLPVAAHEVTASFPGDDSFKPLISPAVTVNVVNERTTTTVTSSAAGREAIYNESLTLTANVTSPLPGSLSGDAFWLYTDGSRSDSLTFGPPATWRIYPHPGTHTYWVAYEGSDSQPPSTSDVLTQVVRKAPTTTTASVTLDVVHINIGGNYGSPYDGTIQLLEGNALLGTVAVNAGRGDITVPPMPAGAHYLHATFSGTSDFEPSASAIFKVTVVPSSPFFVTVSASGGTIAANGWCAGSPYCNYNHYAIYRKIGGGSWSTVSSFATMPSWTENFPQQGQVYLFRMEAFDSAGQMQSSNTDLAMLVSFTDDPITPGTTVKAVHVAELVTATNTLRAAAGLPAISISNASAGNVILASHIAALRTAINEARASLGASPAPFNTTVAAGATIRVQDIQDLREALR